MTSERKKVDICGRVRQMGESDECINRLCGIENSKSEELPVPARESSKNEAGSGETSESKPREMEELLDAGSRETALSVKSFRLITWNIDGLGTEAKIRTLHICRIIRREDPDIVHLQDVIPHALGFFEFLLQEYKYIAGTKRAYFNVTLLKKSTVLYKSHTIINFPNTLMSRHMLVTKVEIAGEPITLVNSHLESLGNSSHERLAQLRQAFMYCRHVEESNTVLLAGDMSVRDDEMHLFGVPSYMEDLWMKLGMPSDCRYTWDLHENKNHQTSCRYQPRCRYDRVYQRVSVSRIIKPVEFQLVGKETVFEGLYPSDHWGVAIEFNINHHVV